ncbi:zinc finger protein 252-like [Bufo gargarizans]|uniref:zinc finger protein 252-like n=1 Tax=Bufo gargarizans TaxID=30331 RepID=UPI001CF31DFB|nr:zinc finger protein 252-like [Bufo gargarizans]XP_044138887.1 zinc finger protein 252-like [Bufo gargarizans]
MPSCLVNQCVSKTGRKGQSEQIILHPFPKDVSRVMVWLQQTGQIFKDLNALAQKILEGNKQNKYRLCSCHFTPDSYIINVNHHGKSLRADAVPSIFPIVRDGECIIAENLKKSRSRKRKRPFDACTDILQQPLIQLPSNFINETLTFEEEMLQDIEITKIGFCSIGTQTDYALSNSVLVFNGNQAVGSDGQDRSFTPDSAVASSLDLMSQLKLHMDSLLQEVPIRFDDVAVYFSAEEWESLEMTERLLYMDVMLDNYYTLFSLGFVYEKPKIISIIEKCRELCKIADMPPIKVKEEPEYYSDTDMSTGYWKVESSVSGKQELLFQAQMCNGVEQPLYHREDSTRPDLVDPGFYNDVKRIKVKEEPVDYSETDMCTRDWRTDSSAGIKQEHPSKVQMCNGFERPVYHSEDSTRLDRVDQRFYNDLKCIKVKEEPFDSSESDVSTRDWTAPNRKNKRELLLQAQMCSEVLRPVFRSEDLSRRNLAHQSFYNDVKLIKVKEEPFDYSETDESTRDWRAESSGCIKQEHRLQKPSCNGVEQPLYRSKDSTRQDLVDQSFFNDVQPNSVKEEHEYFSETEVPPRREESSVCIKQELLLEAQMCKGVEQPVCNSEDPTKDSVDQLFCDGSKSLVETNCEQPQGKPWTGLGATKSELMAKCKSHLTEKHYTCTDCGKCFNRSSHLLRHKRIHVGERPYFCGKCGKSFIDSSQLVIHRRTHTGEKPYACSDCDMKFICKLHLVRHQRSHTGERPYVCSKCGKGFAQSSNLLTHLRTHTGEKPYSCSSCEKCFIRRSHLVRHQRIHTGQGPYACNECDKSFTESSGLLKHLRTHSGEKPYTCSQCPKSFTDKSALANHQRTHTGERPYPCRDCGKTFSHSSALVKHIRIHTGEKPYACRKCGKGFSQTSALANHERTHTGQKPFSCSDCGKCFTQASSLVKHQRTHTGVRPYTCGQCGKSFTYSSVLVKHERTHKKTKVD